MGGAYHHVNRKQDILSPLPESTAGGARVVEISMPPSSSQYPSNRKWNTGPATRSMENISHGTPPSRRRAGRNYEPHLPNGRPHYRSVCVETQPNVRKLVGGVSSLAECKLMGGVSSLAEYELVGGVSSLAEC